VNNPTIPLTGDRDISIPVHDLGPYLGERTEWLIASNGHPTRLRAGGWIYLRCDGALGARVRVMRMGNRDSRPWRTGEVSPDNDAGGGLVFEVIPETWERVDIPLGGEAENQRQGYRYLITARPEVHVHHLRADEPLPPGPRDVAYPATDWA
jgi:hypothetical protein